MKDSASSRKNRSIYRTAVFLSFILQTSVALLIGCKSNRTGPPELVADKIACKKCNMLLSETRYAAAFEDAEGNAQIFDDIGCMLSTLQSIEKMPKQIWVRDFKTDTWTDAHTAYFVSSEKFSTPMNYGFVAVAHSTDADELAKSNDGKIVTGFDTLIKVFQGIS